MLKINTLKELGLQLGLPVPFLVGTAEKVELYYSKMQREDKKGKLRDLYLANKELKKIHQKINALLDLLIYPINIQGGIIKRSIHSNASIHAGKPHVANFDIKNFFPSIKPHAVYRAFRAQACAPDVCRMLTRLTTADGVLPQGFATSPKISGLVLFNANHRLTGLFKKYGLEHTFWIDDLTVSGNRPIKKFQKLLNKIFQQEGFLLHDDPKKTKFTSSSERQTCTGLVINEEPNAESSIRKKVRKELHLCSKFGVKQFLEAHGIEIDSSQYLMSLRGKVSFLCAANPKNSIYKEKLQNIKL